MLRAVLRSGSIRCCCANRIRTCSSKDASEVPVSAQRVVAQIERLGFEERAAVLQFLREPAASEVRSTAEGAAARAFAEADVNKDGVVTLKEFKAWYGATTRRNPIRGAQARVAMEATAQGATTVGITTTALIPPTSAQLRHMLFFAGVPFIGFGFLDNFIMILAGDQIEDAIGSVVAISTLAAAGLGNLVSDVVGLGSTGIIERAATKLGLRPPKLSPAQKELPLVKHFALIGTVIGISIGCLLGMVPLLFMDQKKKELRRCFDMLDTDASGYISKGELRTALKLVGLNASHDHVDAMMSTLDIDHDGRVSFDEYCTVYDRVSEHLQEKKKAVS